MRDRLSQSAGGKRGCLTGPNPTDRGKLGSKIHLICDRNGLPLPLGVSGANMHDSQGLEPLVRGIPPYAPAAGPGVGSRRNCTPTRDTTTTTCADGSASAASATASPARASSPHSVWAGTAGWWREPCPGWLACCRRLHRRYERKAEHFLAFVGIAATLIGYRRLNSLLTA